MHWDHTMSTDGVPLYSAHDFMNAMLIMPIAFAFSIVAAWMIKETFCRSEA
ncbi:MAG: hypothetical protein ACD_45C00020G0006 [uncultured bacterium]|nr:MAG: hypothetical protein ACD_45C00020G0006 [uncultured bacterium]